jgi:hypothetical protein
MACNKQGISFFLLYLLVSEDIVMAGTSERVKRMAQHVGRPILDKWAAKLATTWSFVE